jgi:large subunit ribosomal protein L7/L12
LEAPRRADTLGFVYWTRTPKRSDLENGTVFAHGSTRLNLAPADLRTFVDPPDAALCFGFRALTAGDDFDKSFAVWMATLRRRGGNDAVVESLQRIFPALVDDKSLEHLLGGIVARARELGYEKVWMVPALFNEPLLAPGLKATTDALRSPLIVVPSSGMAAIELGPRRVESPEEARQRGLAKVGVGSVSVAELRCKSCLAPADPSRGAVQRCFYCGATLVLEGATVAEAVVPPGTLRLDECGPHKISVIKVIREHTGLGLKEAKDLCEAAPCELAQWSEPLRMERFHADLLRAGARASVTAAVGTPYRAPEPGGAGVFLEAYGRDKIWVIKVVMDHTRCGLEEAKNLVESAPCVVGAGLDSTSTAQLRAALIARGARVR